MKLGGLLITLAIISFNVQGQSPWGERHSASNRYSEKRHLNRLQHKQFQIYLMPSMLTKPKVQANPGSTMELTPGKIWGLITGIEKNLSRDNHWNVWAGLQVQLIHNRFQLHIPDDQLPGLLSTNGAAQIEEKQLYFITSVPLKIGYEIFQSSKHSLAIGLGAQLNYSGFSGEERSSTSMADSNRRMQQIFTSNTTSDNNQRPWLNGIAFVEYNLSLKNQHLFGIELQYCFSSTYFLRTEYSILLPNNPTETGTYRLAHSYLGIKLNYSLAKIPTLE